MDSPCQPFSPALLERINTVVDNDHSMTRSALSRQVCTWLNWRDGGGRLREVSARVALLREERAGRLQLPPAQPGIAPAGEPVPVADEAPPLSCGLAELGPVEWVLLEPGDVFHSRIWRSLFERYHPQGAGPLCGAQLRYLLRSPRHGWLGGLAFSAPAYRLAPRDRWIGWDESQRRAGLSRLVANSRFLLLPQVQVKHLASHVLGTSLRRLPADWQSRYGVQLLLAETFVDAAHYAGTCYRAANWQAVGETAGRGRNDDAHQHPLSRKQVYLYPLCRHWRHVLGVAPPEPRSPADWAEQEFGAVDLGDQRLHQRLLTLARDCYAQPRAALPQACGSRAGTKAAYRFFDHEQTRMQVLLSGHYQATAQRVAEHPVVLAVQDSTGLNYSSHPATEGLGPLNTTTDNSLGLWMHDTLGLTPEGLPLGLIDVQLWARDAAEQGKRATRYQRPIEEKESHKWLVSYRAASELQRQCPKTQVVSLGDREADLYELFVQAQQEPQGAQLLVRAERTRRMVQEYGSLWDYMGQQPPLGTMGLSVPRQGKRGARVAQMAIRAAPVRLKAPKRKSNLPEVSLWAVWSREMDPPPGEAPLEWMLLTTVSTQTLDEAQERLRWYATRWQIEVYHRTLKSGCRIEERQLGSAKRLEACLAIDMVVAWRIFALAKQGRETPDVPCTAFFEEAQWKALWVRVNRTTEMPPTPPSLREAMRMVAGLGGFLGRKCDGEPGTKSLWLGLQRLDDLTVMYLTFTQITGPPRV
jgi:hypothetical protein